MSKRPASYQIDERTLEEREDVKPLNGSEAV
jgi:hypothetical protein